MRHGRARCPAGAAVLRGAAAPPDNEVRRQGAGNEGKGPDMKRVLVTTQHRGVFAGEIEDDQDLTVKAMPLKNARMAIRFGTTKGLMQLAETGPTSSSKISAAADIPILHDITAIFAVTDEAWAQWQKS